MAQLGGYPRLHAAPSSRVGSREALSNGISSHPLSVPPQSRLHVLVSPGRRSVLEPRPCVTSPRETRNCTGRRLFYGLALLPPFPAYSRHSGDVIATVRPFSGTARVLPCWPQTVTSKKLGCRPNRGGGVLAACVPATRRSRRHSASSSQLGSRVRCRDDDPVMLVAPWRSSFDYF